MSEVGPFEEDPKLYDAITVAANASVDTTYGPIPLKLALWSPDNQISWPAGEVLWKHARSIEPLLATRHQFAEVPRLYMRSEAGALILHPGRTAAALVQHRMEFGSPEGAVQWLPAQAPSVPLIRLSEFARPTGQRLVRVARERISYASSKLSSLVLADHRRDNRTGIVSLPCP
jgi:hypothetical protein